ncbi:type I polyketide synthase [Streptomyces cellulosae]
MKHTETGEPAALTTAQEPIAIVGIGCRFPGANGPQALWDLLTDGRDVIRDIPPDRFDVDRWYEPAPATPGRTHSRWGGFVDDLAGFDAAFFGLAPREAEAMDPQQRLVLECAWDALSDAGIAPASLAGSRTGVFVGMIAVNYWDLLDHERPGVYDITGTSRAVVSGRLSYALDAHGPSVCVDTACSSSLVAVHLACQSLRAGECDTALAAGVNAVLVPDESIAYSQARMLSTHGRCKFADSSGDGFVRSDGAGVIVLRPLARALADGDRVYAVVLGSACNNDGQQSGYLLTPAEAGQSALIRTALRNSALKPGDLDYVEAHGTGTRVGDAVELRALAELLRGQRSTADPCLIGSVKTNIGHTEGAAGIAGLIKTALAMHHGRIPASLHLTDPNPAIDWENTPLRVPTRLMRWPRRSGRRATAGVSSFGIGGTNAHVVLRAPERRRPRTDSTRPHAPTADALLLPVSATTRAASHTLAGGYADLLRGADEQTARRICAAAARRRDHYAHRLAATAPDASGLVAALTEAVRADSGPEAPESSGVVFVFPGQGSQWLGMGRELLATSQVFRTALEECDAAIRHETSWSLLEVLEHGTAEQLERVDIVQPTLWALQVALARLWCSWGVRPRAVIGHSMGEVAAAQVAGALSVSDAARVICRRSKAARDLSGHGAMAVVELPADVCERRLAAEHRRGVCVAAHNSPRSTVVSGDAGAVEAFVSDLNAAQVAARLVRVDFASHSPHMDPLRGVLLEQLASVAPGPTGIRFCSTVRGGDLPGEELDAAYWADNLRQPVLFGETVTALAGEAPTVFVEVSPHPVLLGALNDCLAQVHGPGGAVGTLVRGAPERACLLDHAAELYRAGVDLAWEALYPGRVPHVDLPGYPWEHQRFWPEPAPGTSGTRDTSAAAGVRGESDGGDEPDAVSPADDGMPRRRPLLAVHPVLGSCRRRPDGYRWESELDADTRNRLTEHQVEGEPVVPATFYLRLAHAAALAVETAPCAVELADVRFRAALFLRGGETVRLRTDLVAVGTGWAFTVSSAEASRPEAWTEHVTGTARALEDARPGRAEELTDVLSRCRTRVSGEAFYAAAASRGNLWQGQFRGVAEAWTGPGEVVAVVEARDPDRPVPGDPVFPAAFLDSCCQVLAALIEGPGGPGTRGAFLGTSIDSVLLYRAPEAKLLSHGVLRAGPGTSLRGDIRLRTLDGVPVAELSGVTSTFYAAEAPGDDTPDPGDVSDWLVGASWRDAPAPAPCAELPDHWMLLSLGSPYAEELAALLPGSPEVTHWPQPTRSRDGERLESRLATLPAGTRLGVVLLADGPAGDDTRTSTTNACHHLLQVLRLVTAAANLRARLWVVTRGSQAAAPGDPVANPAAATLWGMGRSVGVEVPDLDCTLVDLPDQPTVHDIRLLAEELCSAPGEDQVALRGTRRVLRLVPERRDFSPPPGAVRSPHLLIRPDCGYLVTGGLGALGLVAADWLIEHGARHLLLVGRTPLPPAHDWDSLPEAHPARPAVRALRDWRARGVDVVVGAADVADETAVADLLRRWRSDGRPRFRGVVHAAGVASECPVTALEATELDAVLRPKLLGGWALHRTLGQDPLDFFVLYSSAASVLGSPLLGGYAAANAALDALAHYRAARGLPALSVQWGFWNEVGMDARAAAARGRSRKPVGIRGFSPSQGAAVLGHLLARRQSGQIMVMPADWAAWAEAYPQAASSAAVRELGSAASRTTLSALHRPDTADAPAAFRGPVPGQRVGRAEPASTHPHRQPVEDAGKATRQSPPQSTPPQAPQQAAAAADQVAALVAEVLRLPPGRLVRNRPLNRQGLDSLMATEVSARLRRDQGVGVPVAALLRGATVDDLAALLTTGGGAHGSAPQPEPSSRAEDT